MSVLKSLEREDKWYLGGGGALVFAPEHPQWLDFLGFWDQAYFVDHVVQPVFSLTLVNKGKEVSLKLISRSWQPHRLEQIFSCTFGKIIERKFYLPGDVLASQLEIINTSEDDLDLDIVLWSAQTQGETVWDGLKVSVDVSNFKFNGFSLEYDHVDVNPKGSRLKKAVALGADRAPVSFSVDVSQQVACQPHWYLAPFSERFGDAESSLGNEINLDGVEMDLLGIADVQMIYLGLHYRVAVPAQEAAKLAAGCAVNLRREDSVKALYTLKGDIQAQAEGNWNSFFQSVPFFSCSDPFAEKYYWYRWYGLRLNEVRLGELNLPYPFIGEGPNPYYFRRHISYSAFCHMLETRWYQDPFVAQGALLNFVHSQDENGVLAATLGARENLAPLIYHANWGWSVEQLYNLHPDVGFLRSVYGPLVRYARMMDQTRDPEESGLYDVQNQFETGQEYTSRYFYADPKADTYSWYDSSRDLRLKGVDATVYMYELKRCLAWMARILNTPDAAMWKAESESIRRAVRSLMWDDEQEMFFDFSLEKGGRSPYKPVTNFYPYMTDIVDERHISGLWKHLLNPNEFWPEFPVPTLSLDDLYFSPEGRWKGKRHICPWNGRVWPMVNSHIVEALVYCGTRFDTRLLTYAADLLSRFIRMMFADRDLSRPNCFEHYNPFTGRESRYRGVDDYQHSWVVDLIIKYVAGVQPRADGLLIAPLPGISERGRIDDVPWRGHRVSVAWGDRCLVSVDGRVLWEGRERIPLLVTEDDGEMLSVKVAVRCCCKWL